VGKEDTMARTRDALRQGDLLRLGPHRLAAVRPDAPHVFRPGDETNTPSSVEEIPFIEVGGPNRAIEASPSVLAAGLPGSNRPASRAIPVPSSEPSAAAPGASGRTGIEFRPLPSLVPPRPPQERFAPELLALHQPDHPASEQYRAILAAMEAQTPASQSHVWLFTPATPGTEATTVLLNLAITRARLGKGKLIVVDANLDRPAIASRLGLPGGPGLAEVLSGSVSLLKAIQDSGQAQLQILTAGKAGEMGNLLVAGEAMRAVLRHLRERFTWVFIDAPCWDGRPDVVALGSACDAVYLVVPQSQAESAPLQQLKQLIPLQGSRLRGYVLVQG
jgi:Mrp family chromosome partitioning ATPase